MKYFRCKKCFFQFVAREDMTKSQMRCGAVIGYTYDEQGEQIPIGCGGEIKETTEQEAVDYALN